MIDNLKTVWNYFLYYPDKTEVIVQVYILNRMYSYIERITFWILNNIRRVVLHLKDK